MAASFMTFTGRPSTAAKSNPTHPRPRLCGSAIGRPRRTGPGKPIDTTSYLQSRASFFTPETMRLGVNVGPDGNDRCSFCPVARILTEVPPTSMTSTLFTEDFCAMTTRSRRPVRRCAPSRDFTFTTPTRSLEYDGFGADHTHQVVPGIDETTWRLQCRAGRLAPPALCRSRRRSSD